MDLLKSLKNIAALIATFPLLISQLVVAEELTQFKNAKWQSVSGTAIHYFPTAIVHDSQPTLRGKRDYSTDTIDLFGDVNGRILYHVVSEFDFVDQTLENTGVQVFSGTVLGSEPVLILDDDFIFQVDLSNGETLGKVYLKRQLAGVKTECELTVVGTGFDSAGNGLAEYSGQCRSLPARLCNTLPPHHK